MRSFYKKFKQYKYVFAWMCDDFKTYDTKIIQHVIPMELYVKPYQQKLKKTSKVATINQEGVEQYFRCQNHFSNLAFHLGI